MAAVGSVDTSRRTSDEKKVVDQSAGINDAAHDDDDDAAAAIDDVTIQIPLLRRQDEVLRKNDRPFCLNSFTCCSYTRNYFREQRPCSKFLFFSSSISSADVTLEMPLFASGFDPLFVFLSFRCGSISRHTFSFLYLVHLLLDTYILIYSLFELSSQLLYSMCVLFRVSIYFTK